MVNIFSKNRFYPQNFFIRANGLNIVGLLDYIADKAADISPECFDAEVKHFTFKLCYHPPYVTSNQFPEIKKLQVKAISNTRFKEEYNGYIAIDLSEWLEHIEEEHFINCLYALKSMAPHWKYVFYVDAADDYEAVDEMINVIKQIIWLNELRPIIEQKSFSDRLECELNENYSIELSSEATEILANIFNETAFTDEVIQDIAYDISIYFSNKKKINNSDIVDYINEDTILRSIVERNAKCNYEHLMHDYKEVA